MKFFLTDRIKGKYIMIGNYLIIVITYINKTNFWNLAYYIKKKLKALSQAGRAEKSANYFSSGPSLRAALVSPYTRIVIDVDEKTSCLFPFCAFFLTMQSRTRRRMQYIMRGNNLVKSTPQSAECITESNMDGWNWWCLDVATTGILAVPL